MNDAGESILQSLAEVAAERAARLADPGLGAGVAAVKQFQHARFTRTYGDLLDHSRYGGAAAFFLDDLYGPADFSERDRQFVRIVPALLRIFPSAIVSTIGDLAELHALSERLDSGMARCLGAQAPDGHSYAQAWRTQGDRPARERQIALMLAIGTALDRYTRNLLLRNSLRVMRGPAQAAGLGSLQRFLERGFDAFRAMGGAQEFLATIALRERGLAELLFGGGDLREGKLGP